MRPANTTLDVYLGANAPPTAPDTAAAPGHLAANFRGGQVSNAGDRTFLWDHVLDVALDVDLRDTYPAAPAQRVFVPHTATPGDGQEYRVVFVERVRAGGREFRRVYLQRWALRDPNMALTLREVDGSPSYATVNVIEVDQADGLKLTEPSAGVIRLDLQTQMSVTADASGVKLSGDSASPGNAKLYGTDGSGVKGWYDQPSASVGGEYPRWVKVTKSHADFTAAGNSESIALYTLGAREVLHAVVIKHTAAFSIPGMAFATYELSVGVSGDPGRYVNAFDAKQAVGNTAFAQTTGSTQLPVLRSFAAGEVIELYAETDGGLDLDDSTAGSVDVWLLVSTLP